jgi:uncharacterized protein (TIGR04255 family)
LVVSFDRPIVTFSSPPVVEVVAGVGFEESDVALGPAVSAFWQSSLRQEFPRLEYQPPYVPPREQFDAAGVIRPPSVQVEFGPAIPYPRLWASTRDQQELVQLHPRYFACNWRRVQANDTYDNWSARRRRFAEMYERLTRFLDESSVPMPKAAQCEVTYINHIRAGKAWENHSDWRHVFVAQFGQSTPYPMERLTAEVAFVVEQSPARQIRLHCKIAPAFDVESEKPLYVLELTARGTSAGNGLPQILEFMDAAREAIDRTFLSVTTEQMHQEWGMAT